MAKQVIFISGGEVFDSRGKFKEWLAGPDSDFMLPTPGVEPVSFWSRNLGDDLGDDFDVLSIAMPLKLFAEYDEWNIWFEKHLQFMHDEVILVGWSLGGNFLIKYLSENTFPKTICSLHVVAGCTHEFSLEQPIALPEVPVYVYHSRDDEIVSFSEAQVIVDQAPHAKLVEFKDRGHFLQESLPELIENIKSD